MQKKPQYFKRALEIPFLDPQMKTHPTSIPEQLLS